MNRTPEPASVLHLLAQTPVRIEVAVAGFPAGSMASARAEGEWTPNQVLWHIRACADVYGEQVARILDEERPSWRHVSPRARMKHARYDELAFADSFAAFRQQRMQFLDRLERLPLDAWQRCAIIRTEKGGAPVSLLQRLSGMAQHEAIHCVQFEALV